MRHIFKNSFKGQTILEMTFMLMWLSGFFVITHYLNSTFEISQKQTMLLRNQAFMQLGNYSDFSEGRHDRETASDKKSQIKFQLGENTNGVKISIDAIIVMLTITKAKFRVTFFFLASNLFFINHLEKSVYKRILINLLVPFLELG